MLGRSNLGDIAIDDINFSNHLSKCLYNPPDAIPTTPRPTAVTPLNCNCSFGDNNLCGWSNLNSDDYDWSTNKGETRTTDTGPSSDHTLGTGTIILC